MKPQLSARIRLLVKYLKTLFRVLKYGRRDFRYAHLVTPKWARASMRAENRFRRAMRRGDRPQIPIVKRGKLRRYVLLNGSLPALESVLEGLQNAISFT